MSNVNSSSGESEMPTPDTQPEMGTSEPIDEMSEESPDSQADDTQADDLELLKRQVDELRAALKKANSEAAKRRREYSEAAKKAEELDRLKAETEAQKLSETERLQKQIADLQTKLDTTQKQGKERIVQYEVRLQAAQMGIVDPDAAARLLDWDAIEYDENGSPVNVKDLLQELLKEKSYLRARPAPTSGGATNPPRSVSARPQLVPGEITPEQFYRLSPQEREALYQQILQSRRR